MLSSVLVAATIGVGGAIITESTLSFLGLGFPSDVPTWGRLLFDAQNYLDIAPHWAIFPGMLIFLTVLSINYIGDGLRDALDPPRPAQHRTAHEWTAPADVRSTQPDARRRARPPRKGAPHHDGPGGDAPARLVRGRGLRRDNVTRPRTRYRGPHAAHQSHVRRPGHAYVYLSPTGSGYCMNVVAHETGIAGAVLLRGAEPLEGFAEGTRL